MEGQQLKEAYIHDDINLIDLLRILWKKKLLILLTTSLCLLLGMAYIFFSSPVYETMAHISPPSSRDIALLNQGRDADALLPLYKVDDVYEVFAKNLLAESTKRLFFKDVFLPSIRNTKESKYSQDKLFQIFSKSLSIKEIRPVSPSSYIVTARGASPLQGAQWVQKYIKLAKQKALDDMLADIKREHNDVVSNLQDKIDTIREIANTQRLDRIQQLKEAIKVAQAVGAKGGAVSSNGIITNASAVNDPSMMYLRGSTAIQAELDSLSSRGSSDAFVPSNLKLRETQAMLDFYKKIPVSRDNIVMFRIDAISNSMEPITPRTKLTLVFALFSGLFLGIILAITRKSLRTHI